MIPSKSSGFQACAVASGDLATAKAERDRPSVRAADIDLRSNYHRDKVAARQAAQPKPASEHQVKRAVAAGVADLRTALVALLIG